MGWEEDEPRHGCGQEYRQDAKHETEKDDGLLVILRRLLAPEGGVRYDPHGLLSPHVLPVLGQGLLGMQVGTGCP